MAASPPYTSLWQRFHRLGDDSGKQDEHRPGKPARGCFKNPRPPRGALQPSSGMNERPPGCRHRERRESDDVGAGELDAPRPHRGTIGIDADHTCAAVAVIGREGVIAPANASGNR